ncbi:permease prefix domain 1-containing protein [Deinococcus sp.]|uniref:permease prefix domain 1-containing protein n=1 Tax=Deinococcus sp. TaxID=47478 RepID=UPI003C7C0DC9
MTRRTAERPARVLSLNQYVHRATLGLPRAERLDAAAELRAHLLERVAELEGKGYARDEAEYLAVRGMGDPGVTNRQLLGHFFTTPLGWACVGLCLAGFVGWQIASQPKTRVKITGLDDFSLTLLLKGGTLPTDYFHLSFDVPPGTRFLKVTWISPGRVQESVLPVVGSHISGYVSVPTWRPWWKSRSPLPYANLPWSKTCHDEQPFHLSNLHRAKPALTEAGRQQSERVTVV